MRRLAAAVWICLVLAAGIALGEGFGLRIDTPGEVVRPGRPAIVSFTVPEEGDCDVFLQDTTGKQTHMIAAGRRAAAGLQKTAGFCIMETGAPARPAKDWKTETYGNAAISGRDL